MHPIIERFIDMYSKLNARNLSPLKDVYHDEIVFRDPLHEVSGLHGLTHYFSNMYANVSEIEFAIHDSYSIDDMGFLYWTMRFRHKKLNGGKEIKVDGHSKLSFLDNKVVFHQDYFDSAAMVYRQVPILKRVIGFIDKRATQL
jgi:hypothetical protein